VQIVIPAQCRVCHRSI